MAPPVLYRYTEVSNAAEVLAAYHYRVDNCRHPAEAIMFEIARDVSSDVYEEIIAQIAAESGSRNRVLDKVKYPRTAPYNPPKEVVVRNAAQVDRAYSTYATNFYCYVPSDVPEGTRVGIIDKAGEYDVAVEHAPPGASDDDDDIADKPDLPGWGSWASGEASN